MTKPFSEIAGLRQERGETLSEFALAIGVASKGRMSEIERGIIAPTLDVALAIEGLSGGRINAATLNPDVAAARAALGARVRACTCDDAIARTNAACVLHGAAPGDVVATPDFHRQILCDLCERRIDGVPPSCSAVDCPHSQREAA